MQKTTRFRQLIEAEDVLVQPGVYDGFSARLVQQIGFAAGSISGAGLSESNLGWADVGLMGYEINELMGPDTIKQMEQRILTAQQLAAKYGAAAE
jgi:2-methylisocitrate lyase-like PEP mutase family enzyme